MRQWKVCPSLIHSPLSLSLSPFCLCLCLSLCLCLCLSLSLFFLLYVNHISFPFLCFSVVLPPVIVEPPPAVTETNLLENVNLTCKASGSPRYYWYKDGEMYTVTKNPILMIADVQPDDRGSYMCLAVNEGGSEGSDPSLVVIPGKQP